MIEASTAGSEDPDRYLAVIEGEEIQIPVEDYEKYYTEVAGRKTVIWNRVNNGHDFCYALWRLLDVQCCRKTKGEDEDEDPCATTILKVWAAASKRIFRRERSSRK